MRRPTFTALAVALPFVLAGCAMIPLHKPGGKPAPALSDDPTAPSPSAPRKAPGLNIDSPIRDLTANPATKRVLQQDLPGLLTDPHQDMIQSMTLRQIALVPAAHLDSAKMKKISADLTAATKGQKAQP